MDSCTAVESDTLNTLWPDRRELRTVLAATGRLSGNLALSLFPALRAVRQTFLSASEDPS
jgi:hypothetical protein